jgi:hypothetical protein
MVPKIWTTCIETFLVLNQVQIDLKKGVHEKKLQLIWNRYLFFLHKLSTAWIFKDPVHMCEAFVLADKKAQGQHPSMECQGVLPFWSWKRSHGDVAILCIKTQASGVHDAVGIIPSLIKKCESVRNAFSNAKAQSPKSLIFIFALSSSPIQLWRPLKWGSYMAKRSNMNWFCASLHLLWDSFLSLFLYKSECCVSDN